jgi:ubiquinone/menaquinone biosynthesis C-methylase UbiE
VRAVLAEHVTPAGVQLDGAVWITTAPPHRRSDETRSVGFYADRVLPRITDLALSGREFSRIRARVCADLDGDVLEVGFGSGRNVPHYPTAVTRVRAVDPATAGRALAAGRVAASPVPVEYTGLDGERLPIEDESVDHVLTTWTLCTIPDVDRALAEMRRVLRPDGSLHFAEHGRAPQPRVARWQDRLTPVQRRVFGGCHLNRQIDELIERAGFARSKLDTYFASGPKVFGYFFEGAATKA